MESRPPEETPTGTLDFFGFGATTKLKRDNAMESRFLKALVDWLAGDLLPLSLVDSPRFRAMIQAANPNLWVPSRGTLANKDVPERAKVLMQQKVFSRMSNASVLHLVRPLDEQARALVFTLLSLKKH